MTEEKKNPYGLSDAQVTALRCVHADAAGVYQCAIRDGNGGADNGHDWKAHRLSIEELEAAFPEILESIPLDDETPDPAPDNYLTDDQWTEEFKPLMDEHGTLVELDSGHPEWEALLASNRIWTMLDCDGDLFISPGYHYVNRISYHTTLNPWNEQTPDVAWAVGGDDETEEN